MAIIQIEGESVGFWFKVHCGFRICKSQGAGFAGAVVPASLQFIPPGTQEGEQEGLQREK